METLEAMIRLFRSATRIPVCWVYKKKILLSEEPKTRDPLNETHRRIVLSFPTELSAYDKPKHLTTQLNEAYLPCPQTKEYWFSDPCSCTGLRRKRSVID